MKRYYNVTLINKNINSKTTYIADSFAVNDDRALSIKSKEYGNVNVWIESCEELSVEEIKENDVDWSKVAVDTPILVSMQEGGVYYRRYFAKFEDGVIHAWDNGTTSWSANGVCTYWAFAKLAKESEKDDM